MTTVFNVEIAESPQPLQRLIRQHRHARDRDRLAALYLRKTGQVRSRRELALGCNESTLYRWFWLYHQQGLEGLLQHHSPPGGPSELTPEIRQALEQKLSDPHGWRSYGELKAWLQRECGIQAAYTTIHGWVRYKLGAKLKRGRKRSQQADPQQQRQFKKNSALRRR